MFIKEHNKNLKNKCKYIWATSFWKGYLRHSMGNKYSFQEIVLELLDFHF